MPENYIDQAKKETKKGIMILIDFNQMVIANFMQFQKQFEPGKEMDILRHMILNNVRMINRKFKEEWGDLVFCCDGKNNWRKQVFPPYKANRKKQREENPQNIDWQALFDAINTLKKELNDEFPYKVLDGLECEADDIIAIVCKHFHSSDKILIISSDKDFIQLQEYPNVKQWSPLKKKFVNHDSPKLFKNELIIKGDRSDGVPNVLSPDDTFISDQRQRKLTKTKLVEWSSDPSLIPEGEVYRNYKRNQQLIDLSFVPNPVEINILDDFRSDHFTGRSRMLNYFVKHRLKDLTESLQEF